MGKVAVKNIYIFFIKRNEIIMEGVAPHGD